MTSEVLTPDNFPLSRRSAEARSSGPTSPSIFAIDCKNRRSNWHQHEGSHSTGFGDKRSKASDDACSSPSSRAVPVNVEQCWP